MTRLASGYKHIVRFTLNGAPCVGEAEPRMLLSDFLRHHVGVTGTHVGCEHGVCGACTILVDGAPARSCLTLTVQIEGCDLRTVEGLAPAPGRMSVLQEAMKRNFALQCGFCTAGILMSLDALLNGNRAPSEEEIRECIGGHLCRCTGYAPIVRAAIEAAAELASHPDEATHV